MGVLRLGLLLLALLPLGVHGKVVDGGVNWRRQEALARRLVAQDKRALGVDGAEAKKDG